MRFTLGIKPNVYNGSGTLRHAMNNIEGYPTYSSSFGYAYQPLFREDVVYGYNIEVFKRGKHRKNKHYTIYQYAFPKEMFKLLGVEIKQRKRTFKIVPKRR